MDIQINVEKIEDRIVLRLEGRLDTITSPFLGEKLEALIKQKHVQILMDFSDVHYLSSAGLRLLLSTSKKLRAANGFLALFSINEDVLEIIQMAGFESILHICQTEKEALKYLPRTND